MAETQSQFWLDAVRGFPVARTPDDPQPGYYKTKVVKRGPWVACRIWRDAEGIMRCRVGDDQTDPVSVWAYARPVTVQEWQTLELWRKENPRFNPRAAVDLIGAPIKPTENEL